MMKLSSKVKLRLKNQNHIARVKVPSAVKSTRVEVQVKVAATKVSFAIVEAFRAASWFARRLAKAGAVIIDSRFGWGLNSSFVGCLTHLTYSEIAIGFDFGFSFGIISFVTSSASLFKVPHFMVNSTAVVVAKAIEE